MLGRDRGRNDQQGTAPAFEAWPYPHADSRTLTLTALDQNYATSKWLTTKEKVIAEVKVKITVLTRS